jgi:hypothetical protein
MKLIAILFATAITSFSLYLTPTPVNKKSVAQFAQHFLLMWILLAGVVMTFPYLMDWQLPFQQGLGGNGELFVRGTLISAACLFCIFVTKVQPEGALRWIKAILPLLVGITEMSRVWDFMDSTINGMLNASDIPMNQLYAIIYPYIILLGVNVALVMFGAILIVSNFYRTYRKP